MTPIEEAKARLRDLERSWAEVDEETMKANRADIVAVLDALDAAERERDEESGRANDAIIREGRRTDERNELAAVIERVRAEAEAWVGAPDGEAAPTGAVGALFLSIINSVPVDVLRAAKAEVLRGAAETVHHEACWQQERKARGAVQKSGAETAVERLSVVEELLRQQADYIEKGEQ